MKKKNKLIILIVVLSLFLLYVFMRPVINAYNTEKYLNKYLNYVDTACHIYDMLPGVYLSIIYSERVHNINDFDKADFTRAYLGFDASVGFGQLKISTVEWIENEYPELLPFEKSKDRTCLIDRLSHIDTNILYSVLYCHIINHHYENTFGYPADVAALASYYGRGIDYGKGVHDEFYLNHLGLTAYDYFKKYYSEDH
jgi:hypothetical protein